MSARDDRAEAMREACAKVCNRIAIAYSQADNHNARLVADRCAEEIRMLPLAPAPIATPADDAVARALREAREFIMVGSRDGDRMMRVLVAVERAIDILAAERAASGPATGDEKGNNEGGSRE